MGNPEKCPHCGSENLQAITENVPRPHHAKLICGDCGRHLKWLGGPVAEFRMPFGQYEGRSLAEINETDRSHLEWIAGKADYRQPKIQAKVREFLEQNPAATKVEVPREIPRRGEDKGIEPWTEWQDSSWTPPR